VETPIQSPMPPDRSIVDACAQSSCGLFLKIRKSHLAAIGRVGTNGGFTSTDEIHISGFCGALALCAA